MPQSSLHNATLAQRGFSSPGLRRFNPLLGRAVSYEEMVAEHASQERPAAETYGSTLQLMLGKVVAKINDTVVNVNVMASRLAWNDLHRSRHRRQV